MRTFCNCLLGIAIMASLYGMTGCATAPVIDSIALRYPNNNFQPSKNTEIPIFSEFPPGEYERVGEIRTAGFLEGEEAITKKLQEEAASMGGDAIVIVKKEFFRKRGPLLTEVIAGGLWGAGHSGETAEAYKTTGTVSRYGVPDAHYSSTTAKVKPVPPLPDNAIKVTGIALRYKKANQSQFGP